MKKLLCLLAFGTLLVFFSQTDYSPVDLMPNKVVAQDNTLDPPGLGNVFKTFKPEYCPLNCSCKDGNSQCRVPGQISCGQCPPDML